MSLKFEYEPQLGWRYAFRDEEGVTVLMSTKVYDHLEDALRDLQELGFTVDVF